MPGQNKKTKTKNNVLAPSAAGCRPKSNVICVAPFGYAWIVVDLPLRAVVARRREVMAAVTGSSANLKAVETLTKSVLCRALFILIHRHVYVYPIGEKRSSIAARSFRDVLSISKARNFCKCKYVSSLMSGKTSVSAGFLKSQYPLSFLELLHTLPCPEKLVQLKL